MRLVAESLEFLGVRYWREWRAVVRWNLRVRGGWSMKLGRKVVGGLYAFLHCSFLGGVWSGFMRCGNQ